MLVPLSAEAVEVIREQIGKNLEYVFTYLGKPVTQVNTKARAKGLKAAGIEDFRWHDLRHTWASWHMQAGTPLYALQQLDGWSRRRWCRNMRISPANTWSSMSNADRDCAWWVGSSSYDLTTHKQKRVPAI